MAIVTLYTSALAFALRAYSRSRLAEALSDHRKAVWFDRLDTHEAGLQIIASLVRFAALGGLGFYTYHILRTWDPFGSSFSGPTLGTLGVIVAIFLFGVGIPNALARYTGERILAASLPLLWSGRFLLYPFERLLLGIDFVVRRLLGVTDDEINEESDRHELEILEAVTEGELHGAVGEEQKEIIRSVFELNDTPVTAIMTPRTDMIAIPVDATAEQIRQTIVDAGHSRVPVYQDSIDNILGVLYAKDLIGLGEADTIDLPGLMRTVPFIPETKTIDSLLAELRQSKVHIAIVLDEYGGTAGLVTIEDILEELVGEIDDEYDRESEPQILRIDPDTLEVDARVHVHEVNEELQIELPEDGDYETIGGFVSTELGKIPATGDKFDVANVSFAVLDAEPRKVNRLRIAVIREARSA